MEVKEGYKQTDIGVIPAEWEAVPLGSLARCFSGGTPSTANPRYYGGEIAWITSSDLNKRRIHGVRGRISAEGLANSSAKLVDKGTLLLAMYGATAGVCGYRDSGCDQPSGASDSSALGIDRVPVYRSCCS